MNRKIIVISNSPMKDIREFVQYLGNYVFKYTTTEIILKDNITLKFHHTTNMDGIRRYYLYHEVFEEFLKSSIKDSQLEKEKLIKYLESRINKYNCEHIVADLYTQYDLNDKIRSTYEDILEKVKSGNYE